MTLTAQRGCTMWSPVVHPSFTHSVIVTNMQQQNQKKIFSVNSKDCHEGGQVKKSYDLFVEWDASFNPSFKNFGVIK